MEEKQIELLETETKPVKPPKVWDWFTCWVTLGCVTLFFVSLITSIGLTWYYSTNVSLDGCLEGETATEYRTEKGDHWKTCQAKKKRRR